jgi:hypothetical protein
MALDKKILSIDSDDDNKDLLPFTEFLKEDLERNKNKTFNEFSDIGEYLLEEIDEKKKINEIEKDKLIKYIIKHGKNKYPLSQLKSFSLNDVRDIYTEIKDKRGFLRKTFHFIFNLG